MRPALVELPGAHRVLDTASLTALTVLLAECASMPMAAVGLCTALAAGAAVRRSLTTRQARAEVVHPRDAGVAL